MAFWESVLHILQTFHSHNSMFLLGKKWLGCKSNLCNSECKKGVIEDKKFSIKYLPNPIKIKSGH